MITGMIELLTARQASGWAYVTEDPTVPLRIRARDREAVLGQMDTERHGPRTGQSAEQSQEHQFRIEFPALLSRDRLTRLTIEAARQDSDCWCALPRHLKVFSSYLQPDPPLSANPNQESQSAREALLAEAKTVSFWSESTGTATFASGESRPVFVVGSARSGTSAVCLALWIGTRYRGFPEGHVFDAAIRLINAVNAHFDRKDAWIPAQVSAGYHLGRVAHARFRQETIELLRRLASGYTTPYWFDKTPTYQMVASVPIIAEAWPNARFIFMKRRGLENVKSRLLKFSQSNFGGHCRDWALIMSAWRTVREAVPDRFIEIDQRSMSADPGGAAVQVGGLLSLEPAEIEGFADALRRERPEATSSTGAIFSDVSELGWTTNEIEMFRSICGAEMEAYGYTYDGQYCV